METVQSARQCSATRNRAESFPKRVGGRRRPYVVALPSGGACSPAMPPAAISMAHGTSPRFAPLPAVARATALPSFYTSKLPEFDDFAGLSSWPYPVQLALAFQVSNSRAALRIATRRVECPTVRPASDRLPAARCPRSAGRSVTSGQHIGTPRCRSIGLALPGGAKKSGRTAHAGCCGAMRPSAAACPQTERPQGAPIDGPRGIWFA